jgi:phosphate:Na+ symporter
MSGSLVILNIVGNVVLLLWGMRMVQSGVERAFGSDLHRLLGRALRNRLGAAGAGAGVTMLLQSSTATAMMVTSFAARGAVGLIPALAVMLGANVGTAIIVKALSFDVSWVSPLLLFVGYFSFQTSPKGRYRDLGRVGIGLGLMLLALHLVVGTIEPVRSAPVLTQILATLTGDPVLDILLAAALTFAAHSSVAVILMLVGLAAAGAVTPVAAIALVLGANLGSALPPVLETSAANPANRRVPIGNLLFRALGCAIALPFVHFLADTCWRYSADSAIAITTFHLGFNVVLLMAFIGLLDPAAALLSRLFPERVAPGAEVARPLFLDAEALDTPYLALTNAAREILRMGDLVNELLRLIPDVLDSQNKASAERAKQLGRELDMLHEAVKGYLAHLDVADLTTRDLTRLSDLIEFAVNLGHSGDILERSLQASIRQDPIANAADRAVLLEIQATVLADLRLALSAMMTEDPRSARVLIEAKRRLNEFERATSRDHLARLGGSESISLSASAAFLAMVRDLKQVNSHLASIGYAIADPLEHSGLRRSAAFVADTSETKLLD